MFQGKEEDQILCLFEVSLKRTVMVVLVDFHVQGIVLSLLLLTDKQYVIKKADSFLRLVVLKSDLGFFYEVCYETREGYFVAMYL